MTLLNEAELSRSRELAEKLFDKLSSISTLKVELVKLGALEFLTHQIAMNESNPIKRQSYLFLLTKYCDHAYCRVKIREANVIPVLVAEFLNAPPCSEVTWRLAKAFQCFLHDPPGLKLMLDSDRFIPGLFQQIRHYIQTNKCPHPIPKTHVKPAAEEDMAKSLVNDKATETDMVRPESPTYTAIAQEQMESQRECSLNLSGPLCKNFTEDFTSVQQFPSSSPGPSWSPSYTSGSFASMSPRSLSSPSMSPGRDGTYGDLTDYPVSFSPSIISEWTKADGMSPSTELLEESETRKRSNNEMISEPPVKRLCTENTGSTVEITRVCACLTPPANSGEVDYAKSTLAAVMDFISYWSNNETFSNCLMKTDVVETLVNYIRLCCDPYRKSLRILVRVVQDPRHREELLAMEFHRLVKRNLCFNTRNSVKLCPVNKTVSRAECWRCQRNCKLGCTAFNEFQMSADDNDYLKGILAHQLMSKSPEDTVKAAVAAGFIVR